MAIETFKLENGMQVILEENHAAKVVSFNALVKVGSAYESDNEAGICHVIEHMLFKGTPTRPSGTIARDIEAAGGDINAYTSMDQTVFYINMAMRFADRGLEILSDAIKNPLFDADELEREKEVILEEIRREQDNPSRMLSENLFNEAFKKHTYGRPIIGFPKTVKSFTRDEIFAFYHKWYTPKNIAFVAVGDFETKKMIDDIRRHFADFNGPSVPEAHIPEEPAHENPSLLVKEMNIQSSYLAIAFHAPNITHPDVPVLDVLSHILGGADSSRLEQEIKEKQKLVHNIYAYTYTPKFPGLFLIGAMLEGEDLIKTIAAIKKEIAKIKSEPASSEEISRAKLNIRSNQVYEKETVGGQAGKIAYFLSTAGSYEFENRYYQMLGDVSAASLMDAARKYICFERSTVVLLVPEGSELAKSKEKIEATIVRSGVQAPLVKTSSGRHPIKMTLKNGGTLVVLQNPNVPLVSICAVTLGGTRHETPNTNGISGLMARALTKGTKSRNAIEIAKKIESMAGRLDGFSGRNTVGLKSDFLSEYLRPGFELFAEVLTKPAFDTSEVSKEKRLVLRAIKDQEDALSSLAFADFLKTLYPHHPYGLRLLGTLESVKSLGSEDLIRCHRKAFRSGSTTLAVAGDVCAREVELIANEVFEALPKGKTEGLKLKCDPEPDQIRKSVAVKKKKQQAHIVLGFQGTTIRSRDRHAMTVLNNILSGQGGRLFRELRDKMSLAYAVSSVNQEGIEPGYFAVYIGTEPGKVDLAIKGIVTELEKICEKEVSKEELERSKQYLVGTYELDLQRNSVLANLYAFNELLGLGLSEVDKYPQQVMSVTEGDVLSAARRHIKLGAYTIAIVKPD